MTIKFKVEYEITPIRSVDVYCPACKESFNARKYGKTEGNGNIYDSVDLQYAKFDCPHCGNHFETRGEKIEITEI